MPELQQPKPKTPLISDSQIAASLRRAAAALVDSIPEKIEAAPLNQVTSAVKTSVEVIKMLEAPVPASHTQTAFSQNPPIRD